MTNIDRLVSEGLLQIGEGARIEDNVEICHPTSSGVREPVVIGKNSLIRSGSILYSGVKIGESCRFGHHVVVRENTSIGNDTIIGTSVKVENATNIGDHVLIETQAHITAFMTIEDYVFVGPLCVTTNDKRMLWARSSDEEFRQGPILRWGCRIGGGCTILPGVEIGKEALIAAGSVVAHDVSERALVAGNPARVIGRVPDDEAIVPFP